MAEYWKVVGGTETGGIVVRVGRDLKSSPFGERLTTDAIVKEIELAGGRLNYELVKGGGPETGWVSTSISGKELCVKAAAPTEAGGASGGITDGGVGVLGGGLDGRPAEALAPNAAVTDPPLAAASEGGGVAEGAQDLSIMTMGYQLSQACRDRCEKELKKEIPAWVRISHQQVNDNHMKKAKGMLYGIEFPWSEQMVVQMGPAWLTKALQTAGTLEQDNAVVEIITEKKIKVTTGNNGGKFLFEVRYKRQTEGLHTKLFAKVPHPNEGATASDRLSTSVNKQPMELHELNSSRLLEATLPVKIPKFYFGDISNETSNFILITEQVPFADREPLDFKGDLVKRGERLGPLKPFVVEGPYDKCLDWTLRASPFEYYLTLVRAGAKMAGLHKAGKMGDPAALAAHFEDYSNKPMEIWGMQTGCSGTPPKQKQTMVDMAVRFMSEDGKAIFPAFVTDSAFGAKFKKTMMTLNAYAAESNYWRNSDQDYIALTHNNLNVDNAFFWRDEKGEMDLGVLDWGSMGQKCLGFKMWYWLYCSDYDILTAKFDDYLQCFVDTYAEYGGPRLDKSVLRMQFVLSAMEQMQGLCDAVPQIFKMCKKPLWKEITSRYDPRIGENIDGKSTLRLYLQVMSTVVRIIHEPQWKGDEVLEQWMSTFCSTLGVAQKAQTAIFP